MPRKIFKLIVYESSIYEYNGLVAIYMMFMCVHDLRANLYAVFYNQTNADIKNMSSDPDYIIEISSKDMADLSENQVHETGISAEKSYGRPYISVFFQCCHVYHRIYINRMKTAYEGYCPRCIRSVRVKIGKNGTSSRFFTAT